VIDFWATWCGPCKAISPILEKLSNLADNESLDFYKVDVDEQDLIAQEVGVRAVRLAFLASENLPSFLQPIIR
jgi:thioredoxin 1